MGSKIRLTNFRRLAAAGDLGPVLVQLMMAVNDIGIADHGLRYWSGKLPTELQDRAQEAKSYFVRLQAAHTFEALKVIWKITKTPAFVEKVESCDAATQEAFARLAAFIGTDEYRKMKRLRNALTFHYETNAISEAINRQAEGFPDHVMKMSIGGTTMDWHFEPADRIADSIIVRDAAEISPDADIGPEVDAFASRLQTIAEDLANFSGYFIPRYCVRPWWGRRRVPRLHR
jgi:hypothetical protein